MPKMTDKEIELLWESGTDVPVDSNNCIESKWGDFETGTDRDEIWIWFDENYSRGLHFLMYKQRARIDVVENIVQTIKDMDKDELISMWSQLFNEDIDIVTANPQGLQAKQDDYEEFAMKDV